MRPLWPALLIIALTTGCLTTSPGLQTQARLRLYNGRNAGEIQGSQTFALMIQMPENPDAAAAAARGLGPITQHMGNTAPVAQHFSGGGVQGEYGGSGWLGGIFRKNDAPPDPAVPAVAPPAPAPEPKEAPVPEAPAPAAEAKDGE
jgi:hypothetical protein